MVCLMGKFRIFWKVVWDMTIMTSLLPRCWGAVTNVRQRLWEIINLIVRHMMNEWLYKFEPYFLWPHPNAWQNMWWRENLMLFTFSGQRPFETDYWCGTCVNNVAKQCKDIFEAINIYMSCAWHWSAVCVAPALDWSHLQVVPMHLQCPGRDGRTTR
jgi:hypothetical protein